MICEDFFVRSNAPGQRRVDSRPGVVGRLSKESVQQSSSFCQGFQEASHMEWGEGGRGRLSKKDLGLVGQEGVGQQRVGKEGRDGNSSLQHIPGLWQLILAHVSAHICF